VGTMVDKRGEKRFPDSTQSEHIFRFNAQLDRSTTVSVVTHDYPGNAVSISSQTDIDDKVMEFLTNAHGLLLFFDPKTLNAEMETQAQVAAFVHMIERLSPLKKRMPIPVALVITKSDLLPGFSGDDKVVLVSPEQENLLAEDFDVFLENVLASNRISADSAWAGSVRNILVKLREFLKVVVGRTLDFQIFFSSNVGSEPEKIGTDVGRSIYKPPDTISPVGVKQPFYWLLKSILRNRKISRLRKVAKWAAMLSIIWCLIFSLPFLWHFAYLLPQARNTEATILEGAGGSIVNTNDRERGRIDSEYGEYSRAFVVRHLFPRFVPPAERIRSQYGEFDLSESIKRLDGVIDRFTRIVADSTTWPTYNASREEYKLQDEHERLLADLEEFREGGDSTSILFQRADRALNYWQVFTDYIASRDSVAMAQVINLVDFNDRTYAADLNKSEKDLGEALRANLEVVAEKKEQEEVAVRAAAELGDLFDKINNSEQVRYRLTEAVTELRQKKRQLNPEVDAANIRAIDNYIKAVNQFKRRRTYEYKVVSVPGGGHLHVEVTSSGEEPSWTSWMEDGHMIEGWDYTLEWKIGDQIHIAFDTLGHQPETGGKTASDKKVLSGDYALFNMDGEITFSNLGRTIIIRFSPPLRQRLPTIGQ